eukprot:GCRY01002512.1.p1 GENE.GCRY01002512.1~~GCRY01002512.1.p1  ORF type:complete len:415 (-),score=89.58 GCRY01002512.1:600-1844(-)
MAARRTSIVLYNDYYWFFFPRSFVSPVFEFLVVVFIAFCLCLLTKKGAFPCFGVLCVRMSSADVAARPVFSKHLFRVAVKHQITADCKEALIKDPRDRTEDDIDLIARQTSGLKAFDKLTEYVHREICKIGHFVRFDVNETVFEQGTVGRTFYFILSGTVSVNVREKENAASLCVCTLTAGESFGELGLVKNQPRAATIITRSACEMLSVDKDDYHRILKKTHEKELAAKVAFLTNMLVFKFWTPQRLQQLSGILSMRKYMPNKVIIKQGDEPEGVYFLKRGECKICVELGFTNQNSATGEKEVEKKVLQIGTLGPGEYFGEVAVINGCARTCSIVTATKVEAYLMTKLDFRRYIVGKTLEHMVEYASKYPSEEAIRNGYYKQQRWEHKKSQIVDEVLRQKEYRLRNANPLFKK